MRKKLILLISFLLLSTASYGNEKGKILFMDKCSSCHVMEIPQDRSTLAGPPAKGIMFHMSEAFSNKTDIQKHIEEFVLNPTLEKAICRSTRRFGLMPSQKGLISKEELKIVATWMIENLYMNTTEYNIMQKNRQKQ